LKKENYNVAVVGATGAVGEQMREVLEEREFPVGELRLLASEVPPDNSFQFRERDRWMSSPKILSLGSISGSSPPAAREREVRSHAVNSGRWSSITRLISAWTRRSSGCARSQREGDCSNTVSRHRANPNCSTIQMVVALKPIHDAARIKRVVVSTYQSVSGAGRKAMEELSQQVTALYNGQELEMEKFPHQIAFNCIPHIDAFVDGGYTKEELKMINETRKIFGEPSLRVTATTVRVPVFCGHSESVNIETEKKLTAADVKAILREAPGVVVADEPENNLYPLAIEATGKDATYVGRIREDDSVTNGLNLWVVADNLRKGAALNAVQIAEILIRDYI
jgi:aspartate-semialdehyde dehydrogenase